MNSAKRPAYLRTDTLICYLLFCKEESGCLISVSCISPFLQTAEYLTMLLLLSPKSGLRQFRWHRGSTRREGGLIAAFGDSITHLCHPHWQPRREGPFLCKRLVTVLGGTELPRGEVPAAEHCWAALLSVSNCGSHGGRSSVKLLPATHRKRVLTALPTEMQLGAETCIVSFIMLLRSLNGCQHGGGHRNQETKIVIDIALYMHVCTWYLHISFNLGSLVSLMRPTLLQTSGVLNQTVTVFFNLKLLYTCHIPLFWHHSKLKIRRKDGSRYLQFITLSVSFSLGNFSKVSLWRYTGQPISWVAAYSRI